MKFPRFRLFPSRFRARRPFQLTTAGWVFILYTVGVGAGAINTGNNLLYLIFGVFLGLIMASGALSDMSLWGLRAECFWPHAAPAGSPVMIPVRVHNEKRRLPSLCVTVEVSADLRGSQVVGRAYIPYIPAGASLTAHVMLTPAERGWLHVRAVRFQTRYPFGLLKKQWTAVDEPEFQGRINPDAGFFVYPSPLETEVNDRPPSSAGANPVSSDSRRGEGDSTYGLRDYRDTDNPRRIHWKASAKRSAAMARPWLVRETERDRDTEVVLLWDAPALVSLRSADRESAIRYGAGLMEAYAREGHGIRIAVRRANGQVSLVRGSSDNAEAPWEFLSLWDAEGPAQIAASAYLSHEGIAGLERRIDVMEAYRVWKEKAA